MFEDFIINGAILGALYALLALGFTLIYGVANILNLSHGAFYMLGAYLFYAFATTVQLEPFLALILAIILVGFVGAIIYRLLVSPIIESEVIVMVVTLGTALILQYLVMLLFAKGGAIQHTSLPRLLSGGLYLIGVYMPFSKLLAFVVSFSLLAVLWIFISKSKTGGAMRAIAQDREAAMLMGINTERLCMLTMAMSATLAALAGVLIPTSMYIDAKPDMWMEPLIISFAVVILGGLGSIKGSLVGAFIIAYAEQFVLLFLVGGESLRGTASLAVMVLVLLLRPKGLFGKRAEME